MTARSGRLPIRISESLLLALVPFLAFVSARAYAFGYLGYFGAPIDLLEIDLSAMFAQTDRLLRIGACFLLFAVTTPADRVAVRATILTLAWLAYLGILNHSIDMVLWPLVSLAFIAIAARLKSWRPMAFAEVAQTLARPFRLPDNALFALGKAYNFDTRGIGLVLLFFVVTSVCNHFAGDAGERYAATRTFYLVRESKTRRLAYIGRYGARIVAIDLSVQRKEGSRTFWLLPANGDSLNQWTLKFVGHIPRP